MAAFPAWRVQSPNLEGAEEIPSSHLAKAIQYRNTELLKG